MGASTWREAGDGGETRSSQTNPPTSCLARRWPRTLPERNGRLVHPSGTPSCTVRGTATQWTSGIPGYETSRTPCATRRGRDGRWVKRWGFSTRAKAVERRYTPRPAACSTSSRVSIRRPFVRPKRGHARGGEEGRAYRVCRPSVGLENQHSSVIHAKGVA